MKRNIFLSMAFFAMLSCFACIGQTQEDLIVIVNNTVTENSLKAEELRRIYFGFTPEWQNEKKIRISYVGQENPNFWKLLLTTEENFHQFWKQREHSGNGLTPVEMNSSESVIDFVANTEGAIGIVKLSSLNDLDERCKVIVTGNLQRSITNDAED